MVFKALNGRDYNVSLSPYLIKWDSENIISSYQSSVKQFLRPFWFKDVVCEEFRIPSSKMRIDLCNFSQRLVLEVSPNSSHSFNPFFHHNSVNVYKQALKRELLKVQWAELNDLTYVEIGEEDLAAGLSPKLFKTRFGIIL